VEKFVVPEGYEIRGMMIRIYPDAEIEAKLKLIESDLRSRWNWLVSQTEQVIEARKAYAVRYGLVGPRPEKPDCDGMSPEQTKEAWNVYYESCKDWAQSVHKAVDKIPCCAWRPKFSEEIKRFGFKYDYQFFGSDIFEHGETKPGAHAYQALVKNYFGGKAADGSGRAKNQRRKKFRKSFEPMPLQVRSGDCFELGDFGTRGKQNKSFYDCRVKFNGLKIRGRLPGRAPWGRVLEGVSISHQADGWWASIKQVIPIRQLPKAIPGSIIGIDAGLDVIAAMSDGALVENPREKEYSERIAGRQAMKKPVGRLQQRAARHVRHLLYNRVVKVLGQYETIKVEKLSGRIGQMGSRKTSSMRLMVQLLRDRYRERVQEVDPAFTSQICSKCGHLDKEAWSYSSGPICTCPKCGHRQHRDLNSAINISRREPLASGEVMAKTQEVLAKSKSSIKTNVCSKMSRRITKTRGSKKSCREEPLAKHEASA
jgi:transposase